MMWGYNGNFGGVCGGYWPWSMVGGLVNLLLIVIFIAIIIKVARRGFSGHGSRWWNSGESTLRERFAKGEISKEEFEEKLKVLRN